LGRADRPRRRNRDAGRRDRDIRGRADARAWSDRSADPSLTRAVATLVGLMPSNALLRAALVLTATGIVSASSVRHAIDETGTDFSFAVGYLFYLGLILIATPRQPPRWAPIAGFALVAVTYGLAIATIGGNVIGV